MRFIHMPLAKLGSFVLMKTEVNSQRDVCVLEGIGEAKVGGRVVSRISTMMIKMSTLPTRMSATRSLSDWV